MLVYLLGVGAARPSPPFPFPSTHSLKLNPPSPPSHLQFHPFSPPLNSTSITATTITAAATSPNPKQETDLFINCLVESLGFSVQEATSVLKKVNPSKIDSNQPKSVINILLKNGFTKNHVQEIVTAYPKILKLEPYENLRPKLKYFLQELGFSVSNFIYLVEKNPGFLLRHLENCIIPNVDYLKEILGGDDEYFVQAVMNSPWLLSSLVEMENMKVNIAMLEDNGFTKDEVIRKFILNSKEETIIMKPELIEDALSTVNGELGIPKDSPVFPQGVYAWASVSKEEMKLKSKVFRSLGWTELDIKNMSRSQPLCLTIPIYKLRRTLSFLMGGRGVVGCTLEYLASHATLLMCDLEETLKPRFKVLSILKKKRLVSDELELHSLVDESDSMFLERYVIPYEKEVPDLYEFFRKWRKGSSKD